MWREGNVGPILLSSMLAAGRSVVFSRTFPLRTLIRSMSTNLADAHCVPCSKKAIRELGLQRLTPDEVREKMRLLEPGWSLAPQPQLGEQSELPSALQKVYKFRNFATASAFALEVGKLADAEGHHPAILLEWGSVGVWWWSHALQGLHENDFIMAAQTDRAANSAEGLKQA